MLIKKRDGKIEKFDVKKIKNAIMKAFESTNNFINNDILDLLALRVSSKIENGDIVDLEKIQNFVEKTLEETGYSEVARSYILYREKHKNIRDTKKILLDYEIVVDNYLNENDWRTKESSTVTHSIGGLILHNSGAITANYWLSKIYTKEIAEAHKKGDYHIHDLSMLSPYCAGWSLKQLLEQGLGGVPGKINSAPAKHLHTLANQMVNFLGIFQNEWAGAQAFSSFDTYLAPFVKIDNLTYKQVKQCIQSFVFGLNTPSRWGTQSPFCNITLDWACPNDLKDNPAIVSGKEQNFTYGDCQKEMDIVNKAFLEIMIEGDSKGKGFQYPIPTYNITKEFVWDNENAKLLFEMTAKYGTPYFQNFINSDLDPNDVRSMCCRLQLDKRELRKRGGGLFGSDEFTGSVGVVTINLPRLAFKSINETEFYKGLDKIMIKAKDSLEIKRKVIKKLNDGGLYPYTKAYLKHFDNHFSTIGLIGMNEMCLNADWIKGTIGGDKGGNFSKEVLDYMRNKLADFQEETGNLFNLEATPAESTSFRLAKMDKKEFPNILVAGEEMEDPYYTNSCHLPVNYTDDIFEALDIQEDLQTRFTGGTVFHTFLGERISDWETCKDLVQKIANNYKIPYFTISPTYSVCFKHGYINGEFHDCPDCGEKTEVYSRITGYYRPVQHWNDGKSSEFKERLEYKV